MVRPKIDRVDACNFRDRTVRTAKAEYDEIAERAHHPDAPMHSGVRKVMHEISNLHTGDITWRGCSLSCIGMPLRCSEEAMAGSERKARIEPWNGRWSANVLLASTSRTKYHG
jgi:hypothetical protein